jgi:hypothetical protein
MSNTFRLVAAGTLVARFCLLGVSGSMLAARMTIEVNRKLPRGSQFSLYNWPPGVHFKVRAEY